MNTKPRDGVWKSNGLSSDFRFIRNHPFAENLLRVETAAGEFWANKEELVYDCAA